MQRKIELSSVWTRRGVIGATLCCLAISSGCQTATGTGALAGGAIGTGVGALAGGRNGALVGGLIGAGAGALGGAAVDANRAKQADQARATDLAARGGPLKLEEVVQMSKSGLSDNLIVHELQVRNVRYALTPEHITYLHQNGVSDTVIYQMESPTNYVRVYNPQPRVVVYEEPAPVVVGGGVYIRGR